MIPSKARGTEKQDEIGARNYKGLRGWGQFSQRESGCLALEKNGERKKTKKKRKEKDTLSYFMECYKLKDINADIYKLLKCICHSLFYTHDFRLVH